MSDAIALVVLAGAVLAGWLLGAWLGYALGVRAGVRQARAHPPSPLDQLSPDDPGTYAAAKGMIERRKTQ